MSYIQPNIMSSIYIGQFAADSIETGRANSPTGNTHNAMFVIFSWS